MLLEDLICGSCRDYVLEGAVQCSCGDRLCGRCFKSLSRNSKFFCPKCNEEVPAKSCFKDRAAEGELKKVSLHCLNDGCGWCGPSSDYQTHKQVCELSLVSCHFQKYGCIEKVLQKDLSGHVSVCSFSPTRCQWCSELVPNIKDHLKEDCQLVPENCPNYCGEKIPKVKMENHLRMSCMRRLQDCEFKDEGCQLNSNQKELEEHYESSMTEHLKMTKTSLEKMEKSMDSKIMMLAQQISDLKSEINHVHREISVKLQPVAAAMGKAETAIQNLQEGFSELALMVQTLQATSYNGTFIWKIPEIQRRRHEAKIGKTISLYSAPFYTSRQGYKACLRLYMDGDGCGKTTHLSFFLTLMKGEYDALLQWPFRHTVTLTLLDQDGAKNIAQSFKPEPTSSSFQRPKNEMNIASGCPMFAPLSVLNNFSYVKDDTMFLKCQIDTTNIKLP